MLDSFYRAFVAEQRYLLYLDGLKVTILVSVIAILIGVALGTILALMRLTAEQKGKSTLLSKIAYVYIDIIRGTPTLTQLMIMYFVILKGQNGLLVGSLTFGLNSAAYVAEIIRAGIQAVDQGQMEGGRSLGLSYVQTMKDIIFWKTLRILWRMPIGWRTWRFSERSPLDTWLLRELQAPSCTAGTRATGSAENAGSRWYIAKRNVWCTVQTAIPWNTPRYLLQS